MWRMYENKRKLDCYDDDNDINNDNDRNQFKKLSKSKDTDRLVIKYKQDNFKYCFYFFF